MTTTTAEFPSHSVAHETDSLSPSHLRFNATTIIIILPLELIVVVRSQLNYHYPPNPPVRQPASQTLGVTSQPYYRCAERDSNTRYRID